MDAMKLRIQYCCQALGPGKPPNESSEKSVEHIMDFFPLMETPPLYQIFYCVHTTRDKIAHKYRIVPSPIKGMR
jgi:hypothetical protein